MGTYAATWEDEENNRQIQFSVDYTTENGQVQIEHVTPIKVSFICSDSNICLRSVRVHTATGREMLAKHLRATGKLPQLSDEIALRTQQPVVA